MFSLADTFNKNCNIHYFDKCDPCTYTVPLVAPNGRAAQRCNNETSLSCVAVKWQSV